VGSRTRRGGRATVSVRPPLPRLHAITDDRIARRPDLHRLAQTIATAGGQHVALHVRAPGVPGLDLYRMARDFAELSPASLFVNDRLDIALACGAVGVQLTRTSLPVASARRLCAAWWIGCSVHSYDQATAARNAGADYLVAGPAYATPTHPDQAPLGSRTLEEIVRLGLPVVAIGGITPERGRELAAAGVYGVAAIRSIWDAPDPALVVRDFLGDRDQRE